MLAQLTRKLRGRSPNELRERATQAVAAWLERISGEGTGRSLDPDTLRRALVGRRRPDPEALLAAFRRRAAHAFFPSFADPLATVAALRRFQPADEQAVLARAQRIHDGLFDLLGHRGLQFGDPIDWHFDPVAGRRAPRLHWSAIPYLDPDVVGDHKVVWELNRHQYFAVLGQAYWYSGDERHAVRFAAHVESWIAANPPKLGINWASSLEVSFRAMSWLWGLHFFANSPTLQPELYARMLATLHVHGLHLERYLSTYFSPNTHLTGEALGLFHLGVLLPELARAERWRALGLRILEEQIRRQVHPDGVYFEQATQYHRYTTDFYLHLLLLAGRHGVPVSGELCSTVERLLEHLLYLSRGDGTMPLMGDDDGGRLVQLDGQRPDDVRGALALGATCFPRPDFRFGARGEHAQAGWIGGAAALQALSTEQATPPEACSRAFPDGGYYVMRGGWGERDAHLLIDCGPHGTMNCGHAHADALSFELWADGRPLVVDPGTFSYGGKARDAFRSAVAHNVVTVDDRGTSDVGPSPFSWRSVGTAQADRWAAGRCGDLFVGTAFAGDSRSAPVVHRRLVLFVHEAYWVVFDRLQCGGSRNAALHFQGAAGLVAERNGDHAVSLRAADDDALALKVVILGDGAVETEDGWVSRQYGARQRAPRLSFRTSSMTARGITSFLLLPDAAGEAPAVIEVPCAGGRAFRVQGAGAHDLVVVRDSPSTRAVVQGEVESDGEATWLRRQADGGVIALSSDVSVLRVGGKTLHEGMRRAGLYERGC